jgi:hypothetical protein
MGRLATWSSRRVQAVWLAWFGLLVGLVVLDVWQLWQRQAPAAVSVVFDSVRDSVMRVAPESTAMATGQNKPLQALPEQHTDIVYSVVADDVALLKTVLILIGPPGILTALWLYTRHRWHPGPPT